MMRPSSIARTARSSPLLCQTCASIPARSLYAAKASGASPTNSLRPMARRLWSFGATQPVTGTRRYQSSEAARGATSWGSQQQQQQSPQGTEAPVASKELPDPAKLSNLVRKSKERFLSTDGIPTPQLVTAALRTCQAAANAIHPYLSHTAALASAPASTASDLLSLDSSASSKSDNTNNAQNKNGSAPLREAVSAISDSAFDIITHPPVVITPQVLDLYVSIQAKLGRPETLPFVLELYASKPRPRVVAGSIDYVQQNPNRADKAIEPPTAENALAAAIAAKNLDAALGVIDCCYTTTAFIRQKLLKKALFPASVFVATPFATYALASSLSAVQNTVEPGTATKFAFAGMVAYLAFTSSIGTVAKVTADDHMKRVTWAPGMPLTQRWLREDERAALDEVACAWGYKEKWRHGEEYGVEWESLREYLGLRGMILDRIEFMEGMS